MSDGEQLGANLAQKIETAARPLPRYLCHKVVGALRLVSVVLGPLDRGAMLVPEDETYAPIRVGPEYVARHKPEAGGYYVVYEDGYASFSPRAAFEAGYTRIKD